MSILTTSILGQTERISEQFKIGIQEDQNEERQNEERQNDVVDHTLPFNAIEKRGSEVGILGIGVQNEEIQASASEKIAKLAGNPPADQSTQSVLVNMIQYIKEDPKFEGAEITIRADLAKVKDKNGKDQGFDLELFDNNNQINYQIKATYIVEVRNPDGTTQEFAPLERKIWAETKDPQQALRAAAEFKQIVVDLANQAVHNSSSLFQGGNGDFLGKAMKERTFFLGFDSTNSATNPFASLSSIQLTNSDSKDKKELTHVIDPNRQKKVIMNLEDGSYKVLTSSEQTQRFVPGKQVILTESEAIAYKGSKDLQHEDLLYKHLTNKERFHNYMENVQEKIYSYKKEYETRKNDFLKTSFFNFLPSRTFPKLSENVMQNLLDISAFNAYRSNDGNIQFKPEELGKLSSSMQVFSNKLNEVKMHN